MPKMRLRKRSRGKRGVRRGRRVPKPLSTRVKSIYDQDGKLILVGSEAEWREFVQIRDGRAEATRKQFKRMPPGTRVKNRARKPLLEL